MKGKAILLSSDSYAALHLIMTRFWHELSRRFKQKAIDLQQSEIISSKILNFY